MLNSIRTRLTLWYLGVMAVVIVAFASITYLLVSRNLSRTVDENLVEIGQSIEANLHKEETDLAAERLQLLEPADKEQDEPDADEIKQTGEAPEQVQTIESAIAEEISDLRFRAFGFDVLDQNGKRIASTIADAKLHEGLEKLPDQISFADVTGESTAFRVHRRSIVLEGKPFRLSITRSTAEQTEFLNGLLRIFYLAVPIALLFAGLSGYFLAQRSLAPVVIMSNQAAKIGSSNLNERLPVKNKKDELGSLAGVFNALLSRLEDSFNRQKQFMADASHELRTPLAIVRGESEVALSKDNRSAKDYRESLAIVHDESKRLTKIVEDLFILARADSGQLKPQLTTVYLDEILVECVRAIGSLAEKKGVKIDFSVPAETPVDGDETLLHRLFLNLLDNAIKYNREGGTLTITVESDSEQHSVSVSDTGSGIVEEDRAKIFDRFYRSDKARTRDNTNGKNGVGLGLSIAAWIAEVHHGSLRLKQSDSNGSVFQVELPNPNRPR